MDTGSDQKNSLRGWRKQESNKFSHWKKQSHNQTETQAQKKLTVIYTDTSVADEKELNIILFFLKAHVQSTGLIMLTGSQTDCKTSNSFRRAEMITIQLLMKIKTTVPYKMT